MEYNQFKCPYTECEKDFQKPLMLTDFSRTPRETYYACPHCLTKVDVVAKDPKLDAIAIETTENHVTTPPTECSHRFGHLKTLPREATIPDGCLTCSRLLQCFVKKENVAIEVT